MNYLFKRDTFFATLSVYLVMGLLVLIPLNLHFLDPIKLALTDLDFNDLSYTALKSQDTNAMDDKIVIVNIRKAGRDTIAAVINKLHDVNTRAIGLDVLFFAPKNPVTDQLLATAIKRTDNIVLSDKLTWEKDSLLHAGYFAPYSAHVGYVNFIGEEGGSIRSFSPFEKVKDTLNKSFATAVVQLADAVQYNRLLKRGNDMERINYKRQAQQYITVDYSDLLNNQIDTAVFYNRIVLIGIVSNDPSDIEDKHFTPLNERFAGKSIPDMNGVILHANIISMILGNNYIKHVPLWINWLLSFVLCWLFLAVVIRYFLQNNIWFHLITKVIQLILAALFIFIGIFVRKYFSLHLDLASTLVAIVLSLDVLYFYEGFVKWLHKKFHYKTIFKTTHKV